MKKQKTLILISVVLCIAGVMGLFWFGNIELNGRLQMFTVFSLPLLVLGTILIAPKAKHRRMRKKEHRGRR
jgi:uncharacterized membrane protein YdjX (TVP38/TMEM64 family)